MVGIVLREEVGSLESNTGHYRRIYRNPPIVEAIVEFGFTGGSPWNIAVPGRLFEQIKDKYPGMPRQHDAIEASFGGGENAGDAMIAVNRQAARVVFSHDNKYLMVGPGTLSVHSVKPYEGWDQFRPRVHDAFAKYASIMAPDAVERISVRYINRIEIPVESFQLPEYFTVGQGLPEDGFPSELRSFFDRMELAYEDIPATIIFTWATAQSHKQSTSAFVLDLDVRWNEVSQLDSALFAVDEMRLRERRAFESLIQDSLRELFDAD